MPNIIVRFPLCSAPRNVTVSLWNTAETLGEGPRTDSANLRRPESPDAVDVSSATQAGTDDVESHAKQNALMLSASLPLPGATGAQGCVGADGHVANRLQIRFADSAGDGRFVCLYNVAVLVLDRDTV